MTDPIPADLMAQLAALPAADRARIVGMLAAMVDVAERQVRRPPRTRTKVPPRATGWMGRVG